ncbi:MAG: arsenate reductase [Zetaproteobacteria bacterium CG1_02_53_45]|nr:MAG: arsenate reductase [Zetaproteobacteria bacterium CG1_02_53_45]
MVSMYGTPNCDTIKKARVWLELHDISYAFHNYKKEAMDAGLLHGWCKQVGWERLLNRRGLTWRKLADAQKQDVDLDKAVVLMCEYPSMIKRPVLLVDGHIEVGFSEQAYAGLFD